MGNVLSPSPSFHAVQLGYIMPRMDMRNLIVKLTSVRYSKLKYKLETNLPPTLVVAGQALSFKIYS